MRGGVVGVLSVLRGVRYVPAGCLGRVRNASNLCRVHVALNDSVFHIFYFFSGKQLIILLSNFRGGARGAPGGRVSGTIQLVTRCCSSGGEEW